MPGPSWFTEEQIERIGPSVPSYAALTVLMSRGVPSGVVYVIRNGLQWAEAPAGSGPHKTLHPS